jgi:hypothetical protein
MMRGGSPWPTVLLSVLMLLIGFALVATVVRITENNIGIEQPAERERSE